MGYWVMHEYLNPSGVTKSEVHGRVVVGVPFYGPVEFAMIPVWPGFALYTVFYGALAWGMWWIPGAMRRVHRRRAGRCVRCGYDLAGLTARGDATGRVDAVSVVVCPECGG
jgi:hypothetical protein